MIQHQLIEKGTIVVEISLVQEIPHPLCLEAIAVISYCILPSLAKVHTWATDNLT
jgi:hypothetical protein